MKINKQKNQKAKLTPLQAHSLPKKLVDNHRTGARFLKGFIHAQVGPWDLGDQSQK